MLPNGWWVLPFTAATRRYVVHQAFEGFALGGIIASAVHKTWARVALVLVFCLTTPVGIAVGLGIEDHYAEDSTGNQAARGVLNAFATGNLLVGWAAPLAAGFAFVGDERRVGGGGGEGGGERKQAPEHLRTSDV